MADEDEDGSSGAQNDDELAKKLERLTEEQQARYNTHVHNTLNRNGEASREYRLELANTLLKNLPAIWEGRDIGELNRREYYIAHRRDQQRDQQDQPTPAKSPVQEAQAPERDAAQPSNTPQPKRENTLEGKTPSGPPRDYSGLERTHEEVGEKLKLIHAWRAGRDFVQTPHEGQTDVLSKERLVVMLEHFPEIRREANLGTSRSEIRERDELTCGQDAERVKFDQTHGDETKRTPQQHKERDLLDYQHLTEQVGTQAKWIARQLEAHRSPEVKTYAKTYKDDAFRAMRTARVVQNQRQNQRAGIDRSQHKGRAIEADQPQHSAAAQEAAHAGREPTPDERANRPAEARSSIEKSKKRSQSGRKRAPGAKDDKDKQGPVKPGKSKGGGRSRTGFRMPAMAGPSTRTGRRPETCTNAAISGARTKRMKSVKEFILSP